MKFARQEVLMEFPLLTVMSLSPQERKEHVHTDLEVTTKAREILPGSLQQPGSQGHPGLTPLFPVLSGP